MNHDEAEEASRITVQFDDPVALSSWAQGDFGPALQGWDRFEIGERLGHGGMGVVYRARDPRLQRDVAVKLLRIPDPELARRFLREARIQAQIEHENVCRVYEVGELDGQPFIAMQLVQGGPIDEVGAAFPIEQKVRLMVSVCEAVHAAHRLGLVHRDLKPANILVEESEIGLRPVVVDFGLARSASGEDLTATVATLGTPSFMSPEQASGRARQVDRRCDVYSLGATLYALLSGEPPFRSDSPAETVVRLLTEEPPPMRASDRSIPKALESIVMRCLEKDPRRRYETASELAADLQRFLDGAPVHARPVGPVGRLLRRARRHPVMAAVVVVASLATVVSLGVAGRIAWQASRRAAMAQRFGQEVRSIESLARFAALAPRHDVRPEMAAIADRQESIRRSAATLGGAARGPAAYAIGTAALALGRDDEAYEALESAWNLGFTEPEVAFARGIAMSRIYLRQLDALLRIGDPERREAARQDLRRSLRDPALGALKAARPVSSVPGAYVDGLIALLEDDHEAAIRHALRAREHAPWFFEARRLEGSARLAVADRLREKGDIGGAENAYVEAAATLLKAIEIGESDPESHEILCKVSASRATLATWYGLGEVDPLVLEASHWCGFAAEIDPGRAMPHVVLASTLTYAGNWNADAQLLEHARDEARRGTELDPEEPWAWHNLGAVELGLAELASSPSTADDRAIRAVAHLERAIALRPGYDSAYNNLGLAHQRRAEAAMESGEDPRAAFAAAADAYRRARDLAPRMFAYHANLGGGRLKEARWLLAAGEDCSSALEEAWEAFDAVRRFNPTMAFPPVSLAQIAKMRAYHAVTAGGDPSRDLKTARDLLVAVLESSPADDYALLVLVDVELVGARFRLASGGDPEPGLEAALRTLQRREVEEPESDLDRLLALAEVEGLRARYARERGEPAEAHLTAAARALDGVRTQGGAALPEVTQLSRELEALSAPRRR